MPRRSKNTSTSTKKKGKSYLNNVNLKAAGVTIQFTPDQVTEYIKCAGNPIHFIKNHVKIVHLDLGVIPFEPRDYQVDLIDKLHNNRFVIAKLPRQCGKSIAVISYLLHYVMFNQNVSVAVLANKLSTAKELLAKLKLAYEWIPKWLQQGIVEWNKYSIILENGSKIIASATSASAVRGGSFNIIVLDEFAFVPENLADEFFSSVYPTISSGQTTKLVMISTPNGMNMFYKTWINAINKRNSFIPIEVHWSRVPGRDAKWAAQEIANTSKEQFDKEQNCEFLGSIHTLITPTKLRSMPFQDPIHETELGYKVYEKPKENHTYVMTVDTSAGMGNDYHAFSLFDVTQAPYNQVAIFRNNTLSHLLYPTVIVQAANQYNKAHILIEINNEGGEIANALHSEMEYENILHVSHRGSHGQRVDGGFGGSHAQLGVKMSDVVKRIGCSTLKSLVEENKLLTMDFSTIRELFTFVAKKRSFEAESGHHDDLAMTLVMFAWLSNQTYFKELLDMDITKTMYKDKIAQIEETMLPFGFVDDGSEDENLSFTDSRGTVWQKISE